MLFLCRRAELVDRRGAKANRGLERDADAGVGARDLLDGDAQRQKIATRASHVLGEGQPEKAKLPHLADDVVSELVIAVELLGRGRDHLSREVATRITDRLLLRCQFKIHCTNPCM